MKRCSSSGILAPKSRELSGGSRRTTDYGSWSFSVPPKLKRSKGKKTSSLCMFEDIKFEKLASITSPTILYYTKESNVAKIGVWWFSSPIENIQPPHFESVTVTFKVKETGWRLGVEGRRLYSRPEDPGMICAKMCRGDNSSFGWLSWSLTVRGCAHVLPLISIQRMIVHA